VSSSSVDDQQREQQREQQQRVLYCCLLMINLGTPSITVRVIVYVDDIVIIFVV
jgi:hypothetical protein